MFDAIAKPFGILFMWLYGLFNNYGLTIILFALIVKVIMLPFQMKSKRGQLRQQRLSPKQAELQKKYGSNKQQYQEELMKMYKEEGVSPNSGCLWSLLPMPIMIALFQAIRMPITTMMGVAAEQYRSEDPLVQTITSKLAELGFEPTIGGAYEQIEQTQFITAHFDEFAGISEQLRPMSFEFLGLNLGMQPVWNYPLTADWSAPDAMMGFGLFLIPIISAIVAVTTSIIQRKINPLPKETPGNNMMATVLMGPIISLWFGYVMPAALAVYWLVGNILQFAQDIVLTKHYNKELDAEDEVKRRRRREKEEREIAAREAERTARIESGDLNRNTSKKKQQVAEKQERLLKQVEWERKNKPPADEASAEPSRVGSRKYARGRAYDPDRYNRADSAADSAESAAEPEAEPYTEESGDEEDN